MARPLAPVLLLVVALPAQAGIDLFGRLKPDPLDAVNARLAGRVLDFTHNHGCDRRVWSPALGEPRDLYVYVPPGYDGTTPLPAVLWMHGSGQDEQNFLEVAERFDADVRARRLPPVVVAAPDGSITGKPGLLAGGSFYINSRAGRFEDYVVHDVWCGFVRRNFAVRPDRESHVLAGVSMGGFGAYNLGFKHRDEFAHLVGFFPPLDLRYSDCHGRYFANYDPACNQYRPRLRQGQIVGRFFGVVLIPSRLVFGKLTGPGDDPTAFAAAESPVEMLSAYDVKPGEFGLFLGYGTRDEFNLDAHAAHFADEARRRGVCVDRVEVPGGRHDSDTFYTIYPAASRWLAGRLAGPAPAAPAAGQYPTPLCAVRRPAYTALGR